MRENQLNQLEKKIILELRHINKEYVSGFNEKNIVFENLNLKIYQNDFVMVIGANGAGKSSLLDIISGRTSISFGKILLNNKDITKQKENIRLKRIGKVFQNPQKGICPNLTVLENMVLFDNKGKNFSLHKALKKKKLEIYEKYLKELKIDLEKKLNVYAKDLSGGQQQVLSIRLATLPDIDILLLDEPTAALDPKTSNEIMKIINDTVKEKNITTIMVTHDLNHAIEYGNRIIMIKDKKIGMDLCGAEKQNLNKEDIFKLFLQIN